MKELAGRTAFVTGAASGIGLGIARALAGAGVRLMLADIEAEPLAKAVAGLKAAGAEAEGVVTDVSRRGDLEAAARATTARFGDVHLLVNNAGVAGGGRYGDWTDAAWDWVIGVNLRAVIWGVQIFTPLIEAHGQGGQIVNTASVAGLVSQAAAPYAVTKYGVVALSEGLRRELAPRGIGVSVLCPGLVRTRIIDGNRNAPPGAAVPLPTQGDAAEQVAMLRELMELAQDPDEVGQIVREGIEGDWPYIFTDTDLEPMVEARFAAIRAGFDRIRARRPGA